MRNLEIILDLIQLEKIVNILPKLQFAISIDFVR